MGSLLKSVSVGLVAASRNLVATQQKGSVGEGGSPSNLVVLTGQTYR